jgi:hypothetical protein
MEVSLSMDDHLKPEDDDEGLNDLSYEEVTRMWDEGEPVELGEGSLIEGPLIVGVVTLRTRPRWLREVATVNVSAETVKSSILVAAIMEGEGYKDSQGGRSTARTATTEIGQKLAATE